MSRLVSANSPRCSIARSLDILGEKWTLLIVREAVWGRTRFSEFRTRLGIAPDVLTDRLATLVDHGILEKRSYRDEGARERVEYVLTPAGADLKYVLGALNTWGDAHNPSGSGSASHYVDATTNEPLRVAFLDRQGREVDVDTAVAVPGPGALTDPRASHR
jgi:DNA-binding HxlR family transcriptional regulator